MSKPFSSAKTRRLLKVCPDPAAAVLADDAQVVSAVSKILNTAAEEMNSLPADRRAALAKRRAPVTADDRLIAQTKNPANQSDRGRSAQKTLGVVEFTARELNHSWGMRSAAALSPNRALSFVGLKTAEKVVTAAGFARPDDCRVAVAGLAFASVSTTAGCIISVGLGCGIGVFVFAYDAYATYDRCVAN